MKTINIDEDVHSHLLKNTTEFGETPSSVLRRLLGFEHRESVIKGIGPDNKSDIETHITSMEFQYSKGAVGRFLSILGLIHQRYKTEFHKVEGIRGRGRIYFARDVDVLHKSGRNVNPKQIPDSPYWVITTTPTDLKQEIITSVMKAFGYSGTDIRLATAAIAK